MPNDITPESALIKLNRIRTDKGERPPEIDMAIKLHEKCCKGQLKSRRESRVTVMILEDER